MKRITFTLCSNNYLAQAKTLGDSLKATNPDIEFIIGLTDKLNPQVDYSFFNPFEILTYDKIGFGNFEHMVSKYNIIEFNTCVKPFYFEYLFHTYGRNSLIYYLDPDISVYASFEEMHRLLNEYNYLITPHITKPELTITPYETTFLNVGIYNLGFIGMRYSENTKLFLEWWQSRLKDYCYINYGEGLFVDQIWINFIHLLFEKAYILRAPGYNMAFWNFYERKLLQLDKLYFVNDHSYPLVFFHFSGFDPSNPIRFTKNKKVDFNPERRPDLTDLFKNYAIHLNRNHYERLSKLAPLLNFKPIKIKYTRRQLIGNSLKRRLNGYIKTLFHV